MFPDYFAISSLAATKGAIISVWNTNFVHAPPTTFALGNKPLKVIDFDFLGGPNKVPRIAAAVGFDVILFAIGE
jgi:hypothetical protein